jgi:hypothetical protein
MLDLSHKLVLVLDVHHPHDYYSNLQKKHLMRMTRHWMMKQLYQQLFTIIIWMSRRIGH